jgi:hypothetical protein
MPWIMDIGLNIKHLMPRPIPHQGFNSPSKVGGCKCHCSFLASEHDVPIWQSLINWLEQTWVLIDQPLGSLFIVNCQTHAQMLVLMYIWVLMPTFVEIFYICNLIMKPL